MIYEIRNYHFDESALAEYRAWARDKALDYLRTKLDIVGFWIVGDEPAEVQGAPLDELGTATVTWIIRWPDIDTRHEVMPAVLGSEEWKAIWADGHPGRRYYNRTEVKFAEAL